MPVPDASTFPVNDPRWLAFRSPQGLEVFHAVVSPHDLWKADPFDIEEIHAEAREKFARTVARINNAPPDDGAPGDNGGKILLLRGESGAGKTHLMRAFRHYLHTRRLGWFAYMQMTTNIDHYPLYTLRNVISSLSDPYDLSTGAAESGWLRLSNFLVEHRAVTPALREDLREGEKRHCVDLVNAIAEELCDAPDIARAQPDINVLRALLFLQRCEPSFSSRALAFLRCDSLTGADSDKLGGMQARTAAEDPIDMLMQVSRLASAFQNQAFVICLDQLEEIWTADANAEQRFRNAMNTVRLLTETNPKIIAVISCLEEYYSKLSKFMSGWGSLQHRVEEATPTPVRLQMQRSAGEIEQMIARRLDTLFQSQNVEFQPEQSLFPFDPADAAKLQNLRARAVLLECRDARERSVRTGEPPRIGATPPPPAPDGGGTVEPVTAPDSGKPAPELQDTEQGWNDFRSGFPQPLPENADALAALLAWAIWECNAEFTAPARGERFAARAADPFIQVETPDIADVARRWLIRICNGASQGSKLSREIADLRATAEQSQPVRAPVAVRSAAFPAGPRTKIAKQIGEMIAQCGGRKVAIEDADWRAMHALREFLAQQTDAAATLRWRSAEKPLSRLPGLRALLFLDKLPVAERVALTPPPETVGENAEIPREQQAGAGATNPPPEAEPEPEPPFTVQSSDPVALGFTREITKKPVSMASRELTQHAAFLGGSGSGKTTAALALIENLLLRGIPAILLDRKGDLATYARPEMWTAPLPAGHAPAAEARRRLLRERVEVRLFTPGAGGGRPLGISLLPQGAGTLSGPEREAAARAAASALGTMMNYKSAADKKRAVLSKAIETLAELEPEAEMTVRRLTDFIAASDESLLTAIGHLETKLLNQVKNDLAAFQISNGHLLASGGERVKAERLFGFTGEDAPPPGKTRLSIISTKFFDNTANALFWTAQFLLELSRFAAEQPSAALQGVVFLDEADLYLPAVGRPVTKEPMENALRRWRSAGLGVLLASQSPGDFDYKCRDNIRNWFVGRVKEDTAIAKMRPMLRDAKTDIAAKLPALETGQFFLVREGGVESLAAHRSLFSTEQMPDAEILRLATGG